MEQIVCCHLDRVAYGPAWELQRRVQSRLIAAHRGEAPAAPHVLLLVEHPPVVTLGKSGDDSNLLLDELTLRKRGIDFFRIDRGGDITYHGPGQLVAYPIFDLNRFYTDVHRYLRELEEAVMGLCHDFGVSTGRVPGRTGVWVHADDSGPERKICAMGIRVSRWVTMHGLALNVATDMSHFDIIIPCGIKDGGVTSLVRETGGPIDADAVEESLCSHIAERFDRPVSRLDKKDSVAFLEQLIDEPIVIDAGR